MRPGERFLVAYDRALAGWPAAARATGRARRGTARRTCCRAGRGAPRRSCSCPASRSRPRRGSPTSRRWARAGRRCTRSTPSATSAAACRPCRFATATISRRGSTTCSTRWASSRSTSWGSRTAAGSRSIRRAVRRVGSRASPRSIRSAPIGGFRVAFLARIVPDALLAAGGEVRQGASSPAHAVQQRHAAGRALGRALGGGAPNLRRQAAAPGAHERRRPPRDPRAHVGALRRVQPGEPFGAPRSRRVGDLVAGARCEIVPDAGHMLPVERPEVFAARVFEFVGARSTTPERR